MEGGEDLGEALSEALSMFAASEELLRKIRLLLDPVLRFRRIGILCKKKAFRM